MLAAGRPEGPKMLRTLINGFCRTSSRQQLLPGVRCFSSKPSRTCLPARVENSGSRAGRILWVDSGSNRNYLFEAAVPKAFLTHPLTLPKQVKFAGDQHNLERYFVADVTIEIDGAPQTLQGLKFFVLKMDPIPDPNCRSVHGILSTTQLQEVDGIVIDSTSRSLRRPSSVFVEFGEPNAVPETGRTTDAA
eukprot:TRINITY_DN7304_c0_g1_i1.p1 TRINITY_DN7304_c0_g1~~TRINITY_DN7304_c0_g1_i1.p1  ORF type:complete len:191 (-),score=7.80 TRINITY_DN7304_c0_g1_i1:729-1301(-)